MTAPGLRVTAGGFQRQMPDGQQMPSNVPATAPDRSTSVPLWHKVHVLKASPDVRFQPGLCCKSRKLQGSRFFAKTLSSERPLIRMTSIALPKSPVNFA